jgi:hypothetical protein
VNLRLHRPLAAYGRPASTIRRSKPLSQPPSAVVASSAILAGANGSYSPAFELPKPLVRDIEVPGHWHCEESTRTRAEWLSEPTDPVALNKCDSRLWSQMNEYRHQIRSPSVLSIAPSVPASGAIIAILWRACVADCRRWLAESPPQCPNLAKVHSHGPRQRPSEDRAR